MESNLNNNQNQQNETIDIKKFIFKILANWYWFVFSIFITISIAFVINRYTDPVFSQKALVLVADKDNSVSGGVEGILEQQGILRAGRKKVVENEIAVLSSYRIINKTINQLPDFAISYFGMGRIRTVEFYKSAPFETIIDTNRTNKVNQPINIKLISENEYLLEIDGSVPVKKKMKYGEWYNDSSFTFCVNLTKPYFKSDPSFSYQYFFVINDNNQLTNKYKGKLNLNTTDKKSTIIELSTQGLVPQKEADFLNKLLEVYINTGLEEKNQIALNTIKFIDEQLNDITDSLEINESRLQNFRQNNRLIDISKEGSVLYEKIDRVQNEKAMLTIKSKYFDYLKKYIDDKKDFTDVMAPSIVGIDDPMLIKLITDLSELSKQKNNYTYASNVKNPATELVNNQIESNRKALAENIRNLIQSNIISVNEVDKQTAKIEMEIAKLPSTEKQLITIQRKYKLNDQIYTYLLTKRAESGIAKASNVPDNKIIDTCLVENATQVGPKKTLNYTIAILIGILIPLIIIIIVDFFNDKILDRHDVETHTNIPIMATIGHNNKAFEFVVYEKPKSSIAESFRTLRTNLQYLHIDKNLKTHTISLTSTVSGEGKSFCALNLASIFALSGKKTIIMGLDLRKPKIHKEFGIENAIGISTYLIGKNTLDEIIIQTQQENLFIVTSGPVPPNPAELLESEKMGKLMAELKSIFDVIIIDTPPVALVTDSLLISKYVDTNIYVIRQNYSSRTVLKFLNNLNTGSNYRSLGILINDVKIPSYYGNQYGYKSGSYGYGYGYGYGYYDDDEQETKSNVKKTLSMIPLPKFLRNNKKK